MSIVEDIQSILQIHEQFKLKSKNLQEPSSRHFYPSLQQHNLLLLEQYQTLKHITSRACLVLATARQQCEQHKNKSDQAENLLDQNKMQINSLKQELQKLHERVCYFQSQEESLKDDMAHLQNLLSDKQKQNQAKEEIHLHRIHQLQEQNQMLNQYFQNLSIKFKNLQIIAQSQISKREKLEQTITVYKQHQKELNATIDQLHSKYAQQNLQRQIIQKTLVEKQAEIRHLQHFLYPQQEELQQMQQIQYGHEYNNEMDQMNMQMSTQLKLLQLSEQITHQNVYINLNQSRNILEQSINQHAHKAKINNHIKFLQVAERKGSQQYPTLRKVASNVDISNNKKSKKIINTNELKVPAKDAASKDSSNDQFESYFNQIDKQAENKLKNLYLLNANKIIVQTQGTDQSCETERSVGPSTKKQQKAPLADPYYIHYLLTVQSIKIEEDEQGIYGILEVDMKPYYQELVKTKVPLAKWGDWIREKLIQLSTSEQQV